MSDPMAFYCVTREPIVLPAKDKKTDDVQGTYRTRELFFYADDTKLVLVAFKDKHGNIHSSALSTMHSYVDGLISFARPLCLPERQALLEGLGRSGPLFDDGSSPFYVFVLNSAGEHRYISVVDKGDHIRGAFAPSTGLLVPKGSSFKPPFDVIGILWSDGNAAVTLTDHISYFNPSIHVSMVFGLPSSWFLKIESQFQRKWRTGVAFVEPTVAKGYHTPGKKHVFPTIATLESAGKEEPELEKWRSQGDPCDTTRIFSLKKGESAAEVVPGELREMMQLSIES